MTRSTPDRTPGRRVRLVEAMLRPETYPHEISAPVRVIETHISHVFLTGHWVYKVKKPVDLGFLDFSTLERRRACTLAELDLNRRLSPDVYAGVSEIRAVAGGGFRVGEVDGGATDGELEEYALKMRQLDDARCLDRLVRNGAAGPGELRSLGRFLAGFHQQAAHAPAGTSHGSPETVRRLMLDNLDAVGPWAEALSLGDDYARVRAYTLGAVDAYAPAVIARRTGGRVRDCHGDLHAGNIFLEPAIQVIDRIEFSDRYRFIDVASDLAFLTMDLRRLGHGDLAAELIASYLAVTGDHGMTGMLPFYEVYRAMVRCKVAVLRVAEQAGGKPRRLEREPSEASAAREYARLAAEMVAAQRPKTLFVMAGVSGSGKSSVAHGIETRWGIRRATSDVVRKKLFGIPPDRPSDPAVRDRLYSRDMSRRTYEELHLAARQELGAGRSVVLDATFLARDARRRAARIAREHGAGTVVVECRLNEAEVRARLARRADSGASESDAGPEQFDRHRAQWQDVAESECDVHVVADTSTDLPECLDAVEAAVWRGLLARRVRSSRLAPG